MALKSKANIFDNVALCFRFKDADHIKSLLSQLERFNESLKKEVSKGLITQDELDDSLSWGIIERSVNVLQMPLTSYNNFFSISVYYVKCTQLSESSIRISVVLSDQKMHTTPIPWAMQHLAEIKDLLSNALTYAKDNHLPQIEKIYLEALDIFEGVNDELVSYFKNFDIDTFLTKEFHICDVELPEPITSDIADEIDKVSALHREDIHAYEILDPVRSDMFFSTT